MEQLSDFDRGFVKVITEWIRRWEGPTRLFSQLPNSAKGYWEGAWEDIELDPREVTSVALCSIEYYDIRQDLGYALDLAESPIEKYMLLALTLSGCEIGCKVVLVTDNVHRTINQRRYEESELIIQPQAWIGKHRVDFLLRMTERFNSEITHEDGTKELARAEVEAPLVVECEGHAWHGAPDQIARDTKRERRILEESGYNICRFTAKQILKDAMKCADEALNILVREIERRTEED